MSIEGEKERRKGFSRQSLDSVQKTGQNTFNGESIQSQELGLEKQRQSKRHKGLNRQKRSTGKLKIGAGNKDTYGETTN